ncbi:MAG: insulinase family protein [Lachnospiraceae bacterium]|nr:insulinase family protein [Lachnospiraceae bacterium]
MNIDNLTAYKLIEHHYSEDLKSEAYLLEHIKSGARICVLENDDENKVFYIAFRTPPKDSTGVAHILEHSVLCGSDAFPLKDPFVELAKSSLNTFLNAVTYPDKTVYPIASCNQQDFKNLMHVYMDAVLHPNIYKEKKIFLQEGWHYETDEAGELIINGVVYNEMKGAFSAPDDVLMRETFSSLFPDTTYGVESGGDPQVIPELTYEDFLAFHSAYYHPANSYIYLYGDADMEERLNWLDEAYLSAYERISIDSMPGLQKSFDKAQLIRKEYPITEAEKEEDQCYLSWNAVIGTSLDPQLMLAFQMIDYALVGADGTPLRKALIKAGIGTEVYSAYEVDELQPFYSIVTKNAGEDDRERFESIILEELKKAVEEGPDEDALLACVNTMEFHFREGDTGRYPKGLLYGLKALDSWLYDADKPLIHLEILDLYKKLRELIGTDYYSKLIKTYLLENTHRNVLVLAPKKGLTTERDEALAKKLKEYKEGLSEAEYERIKTEAKELKEWQDAEESEELLECLPSLKFSDLRKEIIPLSNRETECCGIKTVFHETETNGIIYLNLLFNVDGMPLRLYPYAGLFSRVLCSMDTENYDYARLGFEIDKKTGNISAGGMYSVPGGDSSKYGKYLTMSLSCLDSQLEEALELLREVMLTTKLDDTQRLKEIIAELRSRMAGSMMSSANTVASGHALAYISPFAKAREMIGGLDFFRFLEDAEEHFEEKKDELTAGLKEMARYAFRKDNLLLDVTGSETELKLLEGKLEGICGGLSPEIPEASDEKPVIEKRNEGFCCSGQVQYVCRAGDYKAHGLEYTGAIQVMRTILAYDYLWSEVRVKGGAYGCMNRFCTNGECYFVSYRDPNLTQTIDTFCGVADYIRNFTADEKQMIRYIIGTLSDLDIPMTPRAKGARSLQAYLDGDTNESLQKRRDQLLATRQDEIRALAAHIDALLSDESLCVVGNEETIKAAGDIFGSVAPLFTR